ncbi:MAG: hypothetical protein IOD12_18375 [Silvanigrellales bacterium]|nr:hypothetical protein [Silvanigrellales bacterium]
MLDEGAGGDISIDMAGSAPGKVTYLTELVDSSLLDGSRGNVHTQCDHALVDAASLVRQTRANLTGPFPAGALDALLRSLPEVAVEALLFAGRWDPLVDWRATAATAARMPRAKFSLLDGGHSPMRVDDAAFIARLDALLSR